MNLADIPLVIFAGGKSSRMGQNKALLPFASYPTLAQYQADRLKPYFKNIYLSCKDKTIFDFEADFVEDFTKQTSSPMVALFSIFSNLGDEYIAVLSVDTPFVTQDIYQKLLLDTTYHDVVIPNYHPLCGIYKNTTFPTIQTLLNQNQHSLKTLLKKQSTKMINFDDDKIFYNLNYKYEYERAKEYIK